MQITLPKWADEARRLRDNGMTLAQIAHIMTENGIKVSPSRVGQVVSPNWERHAIINRTKLTALAEEIEAAKREGRLPDTKQAVRRAMLSFFEKEKAMSDRLFESVPSSDGVNRMKIKCAAKGCEASMVFARKGAISPVHAARWFRQGVVRGPQRAER